MLATSIILKIPLNQNEVQMKKYIPFFIVTLFCFNTCFGQIVNSVNVADLTVTIPGSLEVGTWMSNNPNKEYPYPEYYYAFQKGDIMVLDFSTVNAKGTSNISIKEYFSNSEVYSNKDFRELKEIQIPINQKSVFKITLSTNHVFQRSCKFIVRRIPVNESSKNFNCLVSWVVQNDTQWTTLRERTLIKKDILPQEILNKTFRVHSVTNRESNRTVIPFKLPQNTDYWVYWVCVDQENVKEYQELVKKLAKEASTFARDPVIAFGLGLIPHLPQLNSKGNIDYYFMDANNAANFTRSQQSSSYAFVNGRGIISDYMKVSKEQTPQTDDGYQHMAFSNNNLATGLDLTLRVIAFTVEEKYEEKMIRKPQQIVSKKVPVISD